MLEGKENELLFFYNASDLSMQDRANSFYVWMQYADAAETKSSSTPASCLQGKKIKFHIYSDIWCRNVSKKV